MSVPKILDNTVLERKASPVSTGETSRESGKDDEYVSFRDSLHFSSFRSPDKSVLHQLTCAEKETLWKGILQVKKDVQCLSEKIKDIETKSETSSYNVTLLVDKATALLKKDRIVGIEHDIRSLESSLTRIYDKLQLLTNISSMYDAKLVSYGRWMTMIESKLNKLSENAYKD